MIRWALLIVVLGIAPAWADCNCLGTTVITSSCGQYIQCGPGYAYPSADVCDSRDKTPAEAIDCKIDYWQGQVKDAQDRLTAAQNAVDHAKERVQAFTDAKRSKP